MSIISWKNSSVSTKVYSRSTTIRMPLVFLLCYLYFQFRCSAVSNSLWCHAAACQASMYIASSQNLLKLVSIESMMPSNNLILCHPLILPPSVFPSIRVFSSDSALCIRRPKYWSFSFSISPSMNIQDWFPLGWIGWISLQSKGLSRVFSNTTVQKHQSLGAQLSLQFSSHIHTWPLERPVALTRKKI